MIQILPSFSSFNPRGSKQLLRDNGIQGSITSEPFLEFCAGAGPWREQFEGESFLM